LENGTLGRGKAFLFLGMSKNIFLCILILNLFNQILILKRQKESFKQL